ncbi:hypothetical protein [Actinopolyspora halophila]|uniref:hypothetical protein n=1 Tax=Actinopolyspora halophila TaxID=1850 RepID=UPI000364962A|nr:hypothetical protein [Actinopolyspora halophila]
MTRQECIDRAGKILARARARRDSLPPREAAEEAHYPGGPSVDEIEAQIIRQRYGVEEVAA